MYILKGLSCCVLQAALLPGEINCTRRSSLQFKQMPYCSTGKMLKGVSRLHCGCEAGCSHLTYTGAQGFGNIQLEKLVSLVLVQGHAAGGLA